MRQLPDRIFISNNRPSFHLWCKQNLVERPQVSKYDEADCRMMFQKKIRDSTREDKT